MIILFLLFLQLAFAGSICRDGTYSNSEGRGTCSWHGGVAESGDYTESYQKPAARKQDKWKVFTTVTNSNDIMSVAGFSGTLDSKTEYGLSYRCDEEDYEDMILLVHNGEVWSIDEKIDATRWTVMVSGTTTKRLEGTAWLERGRGFIKDDRFLLHMILTKSDRKLLMESNSMIFNDGAGPFTIPLIGSSAAISQARINGKCDDGERTLTKARAEAKAEAETRHKAETEARWKAEEEASVAREKAKAEERALAVQKKAEAEAEAMAFKERWGYLDAPVLEDDEAIKRMAKEWSSAYYPQIESCVQPHLKANPTFRGEWKVKFIIETNGTVVDVTATGLNSFDPELESCIQHTISAWRFQRIAYPVKVVKTYQITTS